MRIAGGLPESTLGLSIATDENSLFIAGFNQGINRYDLDGTFLGEFADVRDLAGPSPRIPILETDALGHVYIAYAGQSSLPRTSFRLAADGSISQSFSHEDLVFPRGIDASANGDVYILSSGGGPDRLFKFDSEGVFADVFFLTGTDNPSDIAINEETNELFMSDEFDMSIHIYDLSSGAPQYKESLPVPGYTIDVFIESTTGRIFGSFFSRVSEEGSTFYNYRGFEIARNGSIQSYYLEGGDPQEYGVRGVVAIAIPEPSSMLLACLTVLLYRPRQRL